MISRADLADDELMRRKVKRHLEQAARDDEDEEEDMEEVDMEEEDRPNHSRQKSHVKRE